MNEDLLDLAAALAAGLAGAGRPKSVMLRRAASTAYYALFHALCRLCADQLVGAKPWPYVTPVYRSVEHRAARRTLTDFLKGDPGSVLATIAVTFADLQDARLNADYNPEPFAFNRNGTIELVEAGRRAVSLLDALTADQKLMLAIRLVVRLR